MRKRSGAALLVLALNAGAVQAADGYVEKTVLFERHSGGYMLYRIPGIVVTRAGTVLAYAEARKSDRSDWHASDIILRRSTDGGRTWSGRSDRRYGGGVSQESSGGGQEVGAGSRGRG